MREHWHRSGSAIFSRNHICGLATISCGRASVQNSGRVPRNANTRPPGNCLSISRAVEAADPSNSGWQRDLARSYMKIGNVLTQQDQREKALVFFENGRAISERLTKLDPSDAVWKTDLEWVNGKIAELKK